MSPHRSCQRGDAGHTAMDTEPWAATVPAPRDGAGRIFVQRDWAAAAPQGRKGAGRLIGVVASLFCSGLCSRVLLPVPQFPSLPNEQISVASR